MQITSEPVEPRQVQLTIVVSPERIEKSMKEVAQQFARKQRIPGYRPGKVPLSRIVALVGEDVIREAASEQLNEDVVREAIISEGLRPSAPTTIEVVEQEPLTLRAMVPLDPEVDLGDYLELRLPRPDVPEIDDQAVDNVIEGWRGELAALEPVDRPSEGGDTMTLALVGQVDGDVVFEDDALTLSLDADGASQSNLPPEVIDELIGLDDGDEAQFSVTYSEVWTQPELQGKEVTFEAGVSGVMTLVAPEIDDTLAQELGGAESVDELRDRVRAQLQVRTAMGLHEEYVGEAVEALVSGAEVSYPPVLLDAETAEMLAELRGQVERQGFTWDRWLEMQEKDEDSIWEEGKQEAESRLLQRLVMTQFVRVEGIAVSDDEIDAEVKQITTTLSTAARRGMPSVEDMRRSAGSRLLSNRAVDRLLEIVTADDEGEVADADETAASDEAVAEGGEGEAAEPDDNITATADDDSAAAGEDEGESDASASDESDDSTENDDQ